MSDDDYRALKDSIEDIGVQNPITTYEGMVLDGWNRYKAANDLSMECPSVELGEGVDPRSFVLAQNKARRHITQAQLGLAVTAVYAWRPAGNPALSQSGSACPVGKTNAELAQIAGVSERTIKQAKAIQTKAAPEVVEAVKRGEIGGEKAAAIAKLPKEQQAAALDKPATVKKAGKKQASTPAAPSDDPASPIEDDGNDLAELVEELQAENTRLIAQIKIAEADDKVAEVLKYQRLNDHASREHAITQKKLAESQKREKWATDQLRRCGKALGIDDPRHIAAAVEKLAARQEAA